MTLSFMKNSLFFPSLNQSQMYSYQVDEYLLVKIEYSASIPHIFARYKGPKYSPTVAEMSPNSKMRGKMNPDTNLIPFSMLSSALFTANKVVFVEVLWNRRSRECTCSNTCSESLLIPSLKY